MDQSPLHHSRLRLDLLPRPPAAHSRPMMRASIASIADQHMRFLHCWKSCCASSLMGNSAVRRVWRVGRKASSLGMDALRLREPRIRGGWG